MKKNNLLKKGLIFLMATAMLASLLQPVTASAASTTEKKAKVTFTKTKSTGFKTITDMYTYGKLAIALGTKTSGNVMSYSTDGTNFKDIDLDTAIGKEYESVTFTTIQLGTYINSVTNKGIYCVMGKGTSSDNTIYNFLVEVSDGMKKVKILKLDDAVKKLDSSASNINYDSYFNYDYDSGLILFQGSYSNSTGSTVKFYALSKQVGELVAYEYPDSSCETVDLCGKYLVAFSWMLPVNGSGEGEFYYTSDYKTWKKGTTPSSENGWNRAYYIWEDFSVQPMGSDSDMAYVYYTADMKKFDSISKTYAISGYDRNISFTLNDDTIFATENGYGDKRQLVFSKKSTKAGSSWKELFSYTAKDNQNFDYNLDAWVAGGIALIKDGSTKKLFKFSSGKEYNTSLDVSKLSLYGENNNIYYGYYDKQYILASKDGYVKNYLFKAPVKFNGTSFWYSKNRYYVYSNSTIYYVAESDIKKAMK